MARECGPRALARLILALAMLVNGHGTGAGQPRIEVPSAARVPVGVPWEPEPAADPTPESPPGGSLGPGAPPHLITSEKLFPKSGKFQKGNKLSQLGGRAKKDTAKLLTEMGITRSTTFKPFKAKAKAFARAQQNEMARSVGGGFCGPSPSSMIQSAAIQMAYAAWLQDKAERLMDDDGNLGEVRELLGESRTFQNSSRQNLLAAHEMCAREAISRRNSKTGPVTALEKAFGQ
jgi:hypothetical protein